MHDFNLKFLSRKQTVLLFLFVIILFLFACKSPESQKILPPRNMNEEMVEIKALLDKAALGNDPILQFKEALPKVQGYSSVDSVWITNTAIFVKFKKGSTISWTVNPEDIKH